jgi:RNase H-fold protein (predicted Holliday junction resolvase)
VSAVVAVDPGRVKAGWAVVGEDGGIIDAGVVALEQLPGCVARAVAENRAATVAVGRGTNAAAVVRSLKDAGLPIALVDEFETSRRARELYFREHPPRGWRRLVPQGLLTPPRAVDDYAAVLIARRFLARENERKRPTVKPPRKAGDT